jgi:excisionase family DNA binding protein
VIPQVWHYREGMCQGRLYTFDEAAELLGISASTLRKKVAAGEMPHRKVFRHVRFTGDDLKAVQEVRGPRPDAPVTGRRRARRT